MKKDSLAKLLELLAGGLALDNAWEQAGFLSRAEAVEALLDLAGKLGGGSESAVEGEAGQKAAKTVDITGMTISELVIYADGASRGNPGRAAAAVVAYDAEGTELTSRTKLLGEATNNVAEYNACILALELAGDFGVSSVTVRMDSELVVRQLSGEYKIKNAKLALLADKVKAMASGFGSCSWQHVPREENLTADRLAGKALDGEDG
jgi:ribonuclease HI